MNVRFKPTASRLPEVEFTVLRDGTHKLKEAYWYVDVPHDASIGIYEGFEWDGCSIPRILWPILAPFELSVVSGLYHDFLYRCGGKAPAGNVVPYRVYTRREADDLFYRLMEAEGVSRTRRWAAYRAVRWFGGSAWKG